MKLIALLVALFSLGLLPQAVLAPTGDGDAAAAVAAHNKDLPAGPLGGTQNGTFAFVMTGSAKMIHLEGGMVLGEKPFKSTVKTDDAIACIQHDPAATGCNDASLAENDVDPNVYLDVVGPNHWVIAGNPAGDDGIDLFGLIDGKGGFAMAGTYTFLPVMDGDPPATSVYLTGKVSFDSDTGVIKKISGKLLAVSVDHEHYASGKFKAEPFVN